MLRRRVAPRRLSATKACVSAVGSGAPRGREAIQRSASSSTGERSSSPPGRPAAAQRRAASPILGVLPDPADVGLQRLGKLIGARLEARRIVEENEVEPPQRLRHRAVFHAPADDRREALVERGRVRDLLQRHVGGDRVGREHEHDRVGRPISAWMRFHQSSKA